jgi:hypothetical protein
MSRCEDIVENKGGKLLTSQTTGIFDITTTTTLVRSAEQLQCVWRRLVTVSRIKCALFTSSTRCLRSRPYQPSCRRFVSYSLSWTKATTQILLESELKGVNNNSPERPERPERSTVANNEFTGICYTCGEVGHRSSNNIDRGRHQSRHPKRRLFCCPDQSSLTNNYVDDNSCLISECDRIIAPRQPQMAYAIGFPSRELSPQNLVFGTVLRAVFSASAMGFCAICSMRSSHELGFFHSSSS